jgi:hypothetical protein
MEAELELPPFPDALAYIWSAFSRLRRRKGGHEGPQPIGWTDIDAFCRISGVTFAPFEIEIVETLDDLYLATK